MKLGLRLQILLLLGGLMALAFGPLFYAVAIYSSYALRELNHAHARALARSIAEQAVAAKSWCAPAPRSALLSSQIGASGVEAIAVYDRFGAPETRLGRPQAVDTLPLRLEGDQSELVELRVGGQPALRLLVRARDQAVAVVLRPEPLGPRTAPLLRLVGLYTGLVALGLLLAAYFALTYLMVRPLDALERAAQRVASGARRLLPPPTRVRELWQLGSSLRTMTERLREEEQTLREKMSEIEQASQRLREAQDRLIRSERLASVGRLAAGLAHEIGNPLAALMGMQDLLLQGGLSEAEERDFLQRMRKETERIHRILRDLLEFARSSAPRKPEGAEPGSVELALEDTLALLAPQKATKGLTISVQLEPELPGVSLGREQLVQLLLNLLLNAADACGPGGQVVLRARRLEHSVRLEVEDNGPGVPVAIRGRLFEPFVTTKEAGQGAGLGLAVCRGLVEAAGGTIALDEAYQAGARFVIELPLASGQKMGQGG